MPGLSSPNASPASGQPRDRRVPGTGGRSFRGGRAMLVAALLAALVGVGATAGGGDSEATVLRLMRGEGALVIAVHDPGVTLTLDGDDLLISGDGLADLRLNTNAWPTDADGAEKRGTDAASRPILAVERGGRAVVDVRWEPRIGGYAPVAAPADGGPGFTPLGSEPDGGPNGLALVRRYEGHSAAVKDVAISPDGKLFAGGSGWPFGDDTARVWDAETGELLHIFRHPGLVQCVAFSPDGTQLLTGAVDGVVRVWDCSYRAAKPETARPEPVREYRGARGIVLDANFSPDGRWVIATGYNEGGVHLWGRGGGPHHLLRSPNSRPMRRATFTPDGDRVLGQNGDGQVLVWDFASAEFERALPPSADSTSGASAGLATLGDDRLLAGAGDGVVRLWNLATGDLLRKIETPVAVQALVALPGGSRVVAVGGKGRPKTPELAVIDFEAGTVEYALNYGGGLLWSAAVAPNGRRLLTASGSRKPVGQQRGQVPTGDNALSLWTLPTASTRSNGAR